MHTLYIDSPSVPYALRGWVAPILIAVGVAGAGVWNGVNDQGTVALPEIKTDVSSGSNGSLPSVEISRPRQEPRFGPEPILPGDIVIRSLTSASTATSSALNLVPTLEE